MAGELPSTRPWTPVYIYHNTSMLSDTSGTDMIALRLTIKDQNVGSGPIPGHTWPFPEIE